MEGTSRVRDQKKVLLSSGPKKKKGQRLKFGTKKKIVLSSRSKKNGNVSSSRPKKGKILSSRLKISRNFKSKKGFFNPIQRVTRFHRLPNMYTTCQNCGNLFPRFSQECIEWNLVCRGLGKYLR